MRKYTKEMIAWLRADTSYKVCETVRLFNEFFDTDYSQSSIKGALANHKIKRTGFDGRFRKGNVPHNKGKKGEHYSPASEFKPGNIPANHRPVGSERVNVDGYVEIKVAEPNRWGLKHRVVWEATNGEIPESHIIVFADGNKQNFALENLVLVSRKHGAVINHMGIPYGDIDTLTTACAVAELHSSTWNRTKRRRIKGLTQ
ncbi:MAG: HNH endonuclease [Clostridiales Family XIII bacterium]|jgi:hypothetical protein|nr:HNH endonuclease [Clostridiales Family XIII bacterium]